MSAELVFIPEATADFKEAAKWYDRKEPGLGDRFAAEVRQVLDAIAEHPQRFAFAAEDVREAAVAKFPYSIFYRLESEQVVVISVFHNSRDPSVWQSRN